MSALYGRLKGARGETTRAAHKEITASVETWHDSIRVWLDKDGNYRITTGDKSLPTKVIAEGKIAA